MLKRLKIIALGTVFTRNVFFHEIVVVAVVIQPLPMDVGMAEDHGAPEAEQLPETWTRGRKEIESRQRASSTKCPYLDSAERDEKCCGTSVRRRCRKDSQFCQS